MNRSLAIVGAVVVLIAGGYGVLQIFNSRDDAGISAPAASGPGDAVKTECPAAGAELPARDGGALSRTQLAALLVRGNVVLESADPRALRNLQGEVSGGGYDTELAAAGQQVVVARGGGDGVLARAWNRELRAASPSDPRLREFAEAQLGRGAAAGACG